MKEIYLDNAATTAVNKTAMEAMALYLDKEYGNPSSNHSLGLKARKTMENARKEIAKEIFVKPEEIIFTSTGTESNAIALLGVARASKKRKVIISSIEHSSIYENAQILRKEGFEVVEIPVSEKNGLDFSKLEKEIDSKTALVSIMHANSETGIINEIGRIGKICKEKNVLFHTDALQSFGKLRIQVKSLGIDLLSAASHKIGGPKGAAFLYIRNGIDIKPLYSGGGQEFGLRSGTQNVPAIVGFVVALKEYKKTDWTEVEKIRNVLEKRLEELGGRITGKRLNRLPTHIHVCFKKINGDEIVNYLSTKGIYCSTGSACDSNKKERRILDNLGISKEYAKGVVRFSLGAETTKKDIETTIKEVKNFLNRFKND